MSIKTIKQEGSKKMINFPQIQQVSIYSFIDEIKKSLENKNFLSALSVSLMIPDICSTISGERRKKAYAEWFNKYVYNELFKN